jgi:dolichol-phosphate mannosyltransferase
VSYSAGTLRVVIYIGFAFSALSFMYGGYLLIEFFGGQRFEAGWLSIMLALFFNTGIILMVLGIMGLFIDRIYEDVKRRPLYFVRETRNLPTSQSEQPDL